MRILCVFLSLLLLVPLSAHCDDMEKQMQIASLKREISDLELELDACKRNTKGWKAATIVGAAGVATTGAIAIGQGIKLHKMKQSGMTEQEEKAEK